MNDIKLMILRMALRAYSLTDYSKKVVVLELMNSEIEDLFYLHEEDKKLVTLAIQAIEQMQFWYKFKELLEVALDDINYEKTITYILEYHDEYVGDLKEDLREGRSDEY